MTPLIRPVADDDLPALTRIYNYYIEHTAITFDIAPYSVDERRSWLAGFGPEGPHRCLVAELHGDCVGWACSRQFRVKAAYDSTVETSVYLDVEVTGQGLGSKLYGALFDSLAGADVHLAVGAATLPNPASVALHQRFGFETVGVFHQVGRKFDRYWDVHWFEKQLKP